MGRKALKLTADTNVLLRAFVDDEPTQCEAARAALANATMIAISISALCEFAWVLRSGYDVGRAAIAEAIRDMTSADNIEVNRSALGAGLAMLDAGGDFADGVIAFEGASLGAATFVSFDRQAVTLLERQGQSARLLK